jgi:predicted AAA+ superfamily ATPase
MINRLSKLSKTQSFFLFGPRGSGKSTLLRQHFRKDDTLWIDLLEQRLEFELSQDPDRLLEIWKAQETKWIVIDEIQKIPRLLDVVHKGIEEYRIKFAMTGSSARKLKRGASNLLAGRAASFSLFPFSALELKDQFDLNSALQFGLLPRYWSEESLSPKDKIQSLYAYVQTYLKEEVASEQLVRNLDPFRRFLVSAAQSNGKILNLSQIERDTGVSRQQVQRHFEIVEDTLLGRFLVPYDTSIRKRQVQKSKFYFFDTGVVRALQNLVQEPLVPSSFEYGDLFETFLINEFFKLKEFLELPWEFSYLRTKDQVEIDLIIEKPRRNLILVEIKSSTSIKKDSLRSTLQLSKEFKSAEKFILYRGNEEIMLDDFQCLPWKKGLQKIFNLKA